MNYLGRNDADTAPYSFCYLEIGMDINSIVSNPWIGFIGTILGIVGIAISIIIYFRTRKFQQPTYWKNSIKWYDDKSVPHDEIKLTFRGVEIHRFTITQLTFWNSGNETIRKTDFVSASPLRLVVPQNTEVFDIRVTAITAVEIQASVDSKTSFVAEIASELPINFEYLDAGDGFSIQIIHDSSSDDGFEFIGKIPGIKKFSIGSSFLSSSSLPYTPPFIKFALIQTFLTLGIIGVWSIYWALFIEFHWYQVIGGLMTIYLILPFGFAGNVEAPKELRKAMTNNSKRLQ